MEASVLSYMNRGGQVENIKYLVLKGGQSVYLFSLGLPSRIGWEEGVINALLQQGVCDVRATFFAVFAHIMFLDGSYSVLEQVTDTRNGRVFVLGGLKRADCPKEVRQAFRKAIGETAQVRILNH